MMGAAEHESDASTWILRIILQCLPSSLRISAMACYGILGSKPLRTCPLLLLLVLHCASEQMGCRGRSRMFQCKWDCRPA
jgi:hypothetical protein